MSSLPIRCLRQAVLVLAFPCAGVRAQTRIAYDTATLSLKRDFAERQLAALAQPYTGVQLPSGRVPGLFPIRATGVSTKPIVDAATRFLSSLTLTQVLRTQFAVDDPEWRRWSNVDNGLYVRQGVSLREMTPAQHRAAMGIMQASLSARGLATSAAIMKTDQTLREINRDSLSYGEDLYFFTIMGTPSTTQPWGWQIDGHHLIINFFVLGDQVVMTPVFMGGEPAITTTGKYAGNRILQEEQDRALAFYRALSPAQRDRATLSREKRSNDIQLQADKDNAVLPYAGVAAAALSTAQQAALLDLVGLFVGNLRDDQARVKMADVRAHLAETHFAWVGGTSDTSVFYYRIHSPVVLIEFDHQRPVGTRPLHDPSKPTRAHIHTMVRTPNGNDYGKDLLAQHLQRHKH
ncbi:MAG: DUF3500 domain-containing protein [Gemmatimonas sp.]|jgi:hypothetical protein|uniref:DUF3500 domain-containing protein n=1 Tax=Gemmatimonas sp. TaxID=1962908 RepID=UPI00391F69CE|nr:DUF3500 domain-containing protein [Gemmatimonadota bacterium]